MSVADGEELRAGDGGWGGRRAGRWQPDPVSNDPEDTRRAWLKQAGKQHNRMQVCALFLFLVVFLFHAAYTQHNIRRQYFTF